METLLPKMRDRIRSINKDLKLSIICDNMMLLNEESDIITYDDSNLCLYAVHRANSQDNISDCSFMVVPYSMVQYIEVNDSVHNVAKLGKEFNMDTKAVENFVKENTTIEL